MRRMVGLGAALGLVLGALLGAPIVAADPSGVDIQPPSAVSSFGDHVTWSTSFSSTAPPTRVELMTQLEGTATWFVREASPVRTGLSTTGSGEYRVDVVDHGFYLPNGVIRFRFRVVAQGAVVDGPESTIRIADDRVAWRTIGGDLVRLHWSQGDEAFARRALRIAEDAITAASDLLGVTETRQVDFFIYSDAELFRTAIGPDTKEFVAGRAVPEVRTLYGQILPGQIGDDWVSIMITHELTHLVFHTATANAFNEPLHWLNEGLATYLSEGYGAADRQRIANAVERGTILPLDALAFGFPTAREELFYLGYAEGTAAVDFFIRTYGEPRLVELIRGYAQGITDDEAFTAATGAGVEAFGRAWLKDAGAAAPTAYGPRAPAPGPTPADWTSGAASSTPGPTDAGARPSPSATPAATSSGGAGAVTGFVIGVLATSLVVLAVAALLWLRRPRAARPPPGAGSGERDDGTGP